MNRACPARRRGAALLALVVVLGLLATVLTAAAWQVSANRRAVARRTQQRQAIWLARAGVEFAVQKLLADADYRGETVEVLPGTKVEIVVRRAQDVVTIVSAARNPADAPRVTVRTMTRRFRRIGSGDTARLEPLPQ